MYKLLQFCNFVFSFGFLLIYMFLILIYRSETEVLQAKCHYRQAIVDGIVYHLNDDVYIQVSVVYSFFFLEKRKRLLYYNACSVSTYTNRLLYMCHCFILV